MALIVTLSLLLSYATINCTVWLRKYMIIIIIIITIIIIIIIIINMNNTDEASSLL